MATLSYPAPNEADRLPESERIRMGLPKDPTKIKGRRQTYAGEGQWKMKKINWGSLLATASAVLSLAGLGAIVLVMLYMGSN